MVKPAARATAHPKVILPPEERIARAIADSARARAEIEAEAKVASPYTWKLVSRTVAAGAVMGFLSPFVLSRSHWQSMMSFLSGSLFVRIVATAAVAALAQAFFWMRENRPRTYGTLEFALGTTSTFLALSADATMFEHGLKLATGLYLMVRGFDNSINGYSRLLHRREDAAKTALAEAQAELAKQKPSDSAAALETPQV